MMGRPPLPPEDLRSIRLATKLRPAEVDAVTEAAKIARTDRSEFLRLALTLLVRTRHAIGAERFRSYAAKFREKP